MLSILHTKYEASVNDFDTVLFCIELSSDEAKCIKIETVLVIPDAMLGFFFCVSLTKLMQIFSFALSLYALCYCVFYFANKSVGAIIRARIKTIRASEERERAPGCHYSGPGDSSGGPGGHRPPSANQRPVPGSRDQSRPIRGQCW